MKEAKQKRKIFRGRKLMGIPVWLMALWIAIGLVVGIVITTYEVYYAGQEEDIPLEGITAKIWIDGQPLYEQVFDMPDDVFSDSKLVAGEVEVFIHNITIAPENGNWDAAFSWNSNLCDEPLEEFYGYGLTILDGSDIEIIGSLRINANETKTFKLRHELDSNFLHTDNPFPLDLDILLKEIFELFPELSWHLDENTGTTAGDDSGNGFDGTVNGAVWTTGKINSALDFDGINDYVSEDTATAGDFELTDAFSLEAWFNVDGFIGDPAIISKMGGTDIGYALIVMPNQKVQLVLRSTGGQGMVCIVDSIVADQWYHVIATYDGSSSATGMHIYLDAVDKPINLQSDMLSGSIANAFPLLVGTYQIGTEIGIEPFDGIIDEVVIYPYELSEEEVIWRYNEGNGKQEFTE